MIFFVSYPKSGRTWVRFMIDRYLCRLHGLELPNVFDIEEHAGVEYPVKWTHLTAAMLQKLPYYCIGCGDWNALTGAGAILLVRNFHATLASAYHQAVYRIGVFDGAPSAFLRSPQYGAIKLITFYNLWEQLKTALPLTAAVRYERFLEDPCDALQSVLCVIGIESRPDLVASVVAESNFESMRALGRTPAYAGSVLAPRDAGDPRTDKVRIGGDSNYRDLFSEDDIAFITRLAEDLLVNKDADYYRGCWERGAEVENFSPAEASQHRPGLRRVHA